MARRTYCIQVQTNDEELKIIRDKARKSNLPISTWLRKLALEAEVK